MAKRRVFVLAVALASLPALAVAGSPPTDIAKALAPEVLQVVSGGNWDDGGKKGAYRAVLVAPEPGGGAELVVQWLAPGQPGGAPILVASALVKEIADLKLPDATLSAEFESANEYTVFVEPDDPSKDAGQSYTVLVGVPGKYTFSLGAPPE
jgi:hypothetical protein